MGKTLFESPLFTRISNDDPAVVIAAIFAAILPPLVLFTITRLLSRRVSDVWKRRLHKIVLFISLAWVVMSISPSLAGFSFIFTAYLVPIYFLYRYRMSTKPSIKIIRNITGALIIFSSIPYIITFAPGFYLVSLLGWTGDSLSTQSLSEQLYLRMLAAVFMLVVAAFTGSGLMIIMKPKYRISYILLTVIITIFMTAAFFYQTPRYW